ncbi:unnamed protein product [Rotaria magnacalcarata]|uniref:Uncharacterized protein n=2 Tax=Rotaria magnacalcarata TaxID=392030 RepID=A0A815ZBQ9_9BILA|nr:unnamed protein product [Rotaria magnacalcarata]
MLYTARRAVPMDKYNRKLFESFLRFQESAKCSSTMNVNSHGPTFQGLNATSLGLCSFALTAFCVSMYLIGATVPVNVSMGVIMGAILFYSGATQSLAGYPEYCDGNNFGALTFCSYRAFWLSLASLYIVAFDFLAGYKNESVLNNAIGVFFLHGQFFTALVLLSSLRTNLVTIALFFFLLICFILLTSSKFLNEHQNLQRASGAFGILTTPLAWYSAFAHLLNKSD